MRRTTLLAGLLLLAFIAAMAGFYHWFNRGSASGLPVPDRTLGRMVSISGGTFRMGNDASTREAERPAHEVKVDAFEIDEHEVTNSQFAEFVRKTGYVTTAEERGHSHGLRSGKAAVEEMPRRRLASSRRAGNDARRQRRLSGGSRLLVRRPGLLPAGRASACRRRPSGNSPRGAACATPIIRGAAKKRPAAASWPTPGSTTGSPPPTAF